MNKSNRMSKQTTPNTQIDTDTKESKEQTFFNNMVKQLNDGYEVVTNKGVAPQLLFPAKILNFLKTNPNIKFKSDAMNKLVTHLGRQVVRKVLSDFNEIPDTTVSPRDVRNILAREDVALDYEKQQEESK